MKLYDTQGAPSPRRVRIFLAEKGITMETRPVSLKDRQQLGEDFKRTNPRCLVPVLELDDGTTIDESVAICRYLEELYPEPPLMGLDPLDKARVESWQRRMELDGYLAVVAMLRNSNPVFADRAIPGVAGGYPAIPELAERGRRQYAEFLEGLNRRLAESDYVAGGSYSIADITALVTVDFARRVDLKLPENHGHTRRWYERVASRPSARA